MLIAVVLLFLVCQCPTAITLIYTAFHDLDPNTNRGVLVRGLGNIFNFLMAINAAGNFVLYCLLSQKYRRTFVQSFCPCLKGRVQMFQSAYYTANNSTIKTAAKGSAKSSLKTGTVNNRAAQTKRMVSYKESFDSTGVDVTENTRLNGTVRTASVDKW